VRCGWDEVEASDLEDLKRQCAVVPQMMVLTRLAR